MLLIYTGNGKGKTSACVGQAIRALGQGLRVAFAQCMKEDGKAGEQKMLRSLLGDLFYVGGKGFFRHEEERLLHREAAVSTLAWAQTRLPNLDMLILDECLYALKADLLTQKELLEFIEKTVLCNTHVVLSGRGAPDWLLEKADLVTEMLEVKHPWRGGVGATLGIEY